MGCQFNASSRAFWGIPTILEGMKMLVREGVLSILRAYKRNCTEKCNFLEIVVFGSVAHGEVERTAIWIFALERRTSVYTISCTSKKNIQDRLQRPVDVVRMREQMNQTLSCINGRIDRDAIYV